MRCCVGCLILPATGGEYSANKGLFSSPWEQAQNKLQSAALSGPLGTKMLDSLRELNPWRASGAPLNARLLRHLLIVAAVLLLAYNFGREPSLLYVYLPVVLVALWAIYKNPGLGLFCTLAAARVVPFAIGTGTGSAVNIVLLAVPLLLGLWLVAMVWERRIQLAPSAANLPLVGMVVAISVSFLVGYLPWNVFAQLAPGARPARRGRHFRIFSRRVLAGGQSHQGSALAQADGVAVPGAGWYLHRLPAAEPCGKHNS